MHTTLATALFACTLLGTVLHAQRVSAEFTPTPAAPGATVTLVCKDITGAGLQLPSPCTWYAIHQGARSGPIVPLGIGCPTVIVPVAPNATFQTTWDQRDANNQLVPPGRYWFEVRTWDNAFSLLVVDWFCLSIQAASEPALRPGGMARLGQTTPLQVQAPQLPGALFVAAASLSSNNPVQVFGLDTCLSLPVFLDLLVAPIGVLDGSGNSTGLGLAIPNVPVALQVGIHVQALLVGSTGMQTTNDASFVVRP